MTCSGNKIFELCTPSGPSGNHLDQAHSNANEEKASQKWNEVRQYIREHYFPDLSVNRGPRISERTRRAINAAGGMAYLSECVGDDLVFARKRFIECYLRWDELRVDEFLLPEGEVKNLLSKAAQKISATRLLDAPKPVGRPAPTTMRAAELVPTKSEPTPLVITQSRLDLLKKQREELLARATPDEIREAERLRAL